MQTETTAFFPGIQKGRPALVLAPMEGVTDAPMRAFLTERGGFGFCVSEFLRVSQEAPPAKIFLEHVPELRNGGRTASGIPVQVQLLGGDPGKMAEAAFRATQAGARAIDINFGCPAPTVNRHDGGATLLKYPLRIRAIVEAVRRAIPGEIPVSAKLRLGWENIEDIYENGVRAAEGGASWLTIHARTRMQGYRPPVYWKPIAEARRQVGKIPIVANGDIWTIEDFQRCREESGAEHFMLGRCALSDPLLPLRAARILGIGMDSLFAPLMPLVPLAEDERPMSEDPREWIPLFRRFAEIVSFYPDYACRKHYRVNRIKQWIKLARVGRRPEAFPWFESIKQAQTLEEMFECLGKPGNLPPPACLSALPTAAI